MARQLRCHQFARADFALQCHFQRRLCLHPRGKQVGPRLADSARRYVEQSYGYEARCAAIATGEAFSATRWAQMAELGWLALAVPERLGGLGGSAVDFALLVEQLGAGMLLEPLVPVVAATAALAAAGASEAFIASVMEGHARPVLAHGDLSAL